MNHWKFLEQKLGRDVVRYCIQPLNLPSLRRVRIAREELYEEIQRCFGWYGLNPKDYEGLEENEMPSVKQILREHRDSRWYRDIKIKELSCQILAHQKKLQEVMKQFNIPMTYSMWRINFNLVIEQLSYFHYLKRREKESMIGRSSTINDWIKLLNRQTPLDSLW